nr:MAG TPA_asm: hypothetical protein [Caudoviricetes sp.]
MNFLVYTLFCSIFYFLVYARVRTYIIYMIRNSRIANFSQIEKIK